ncbi:MAG TPA: hypothetical protein VF330_36225, partial [Lentzea sp.]
ILGDLARVEATIRNLMESAPLGREQNRVAPPSSRDSSAEPQPEEPPLPPVEEIVVPPSPRRAAPGKPRSSGPASMPQRRKTESKT